MEQFLATFPGTVVAITHDRYFLDNVAGWILELDRGQGIPFEGNYSSWLESKSRRLEAESKKQGFFSRTINQELEWVRKNAKGRRRRARRAFERTRNSARRRTSLTARAELDSITIPAAPRLGSTVIDVEGVTKGYDSRGLLIEDLNCMIPPGAVVGIVGANGAGKTTLFKMITGWTSPTRARWWLARR